MNHVWLLRVVICLRNAVIGNLRMQASDWMVDLEVA